MRKTLSLPSVLLLTFLLAARPLQAQVPEKGRAYLAFLWTAFKGLERAAALFSPSRMISPLADGGGDGGGGDGGGGGGGGDGGGDGSGSGDGSGDGSSSADGSGNSDGNGDATDGVSADSAAADANAPDAQTSPTDPESIPTNDPTMSLRGGVPEGSAQSPGFDGVTIPLGAQSVPPPVAGRASQDVAIHAVIISGVQSPWNAISKAPGVRNVILTGGLVALGKTPRPGEAAAGGTPPPFLKIIPEPNLLDGSIVPPVVPNVIDVRIVGYSVTAEMPAK